MLPLLKEKQCGALGQPVCGTFVVRLQTEQKGSGSTGRGPPSLNGCSPSHNKTFPLSPGFFMWAKGWTEQILL